MVRSPILSQIKVPVFKLDDLIKVLGLPSPTKLKIDVDGVDLAVLEGSSNALTTVTSLIIEYMPNSQTRQKFTIFWEIMDLLSTLTQKENTVGAQLTDFSQDVSKYREQWSLDSQVAYLNHGSFGAVPKVVAAAQREIQQLEENNPNLFFRTTLPKLYDQARTQVATWLESHLNYLHLCLTRLKELSLQQAR